MRLTLLLLLATSLAACQGASDEMASADRDATSVESATVAESEPLADPLGRDLVRTGDVVVRTSDPDAAAARARAMARQLGGVVTDEQRTHADTRTEVRLTLRVPAARFDTLLTVVTALPGTVEQRAVRVDDVTRAVADTEARLRARRAAEARLLTLLERADDVDDVLAVQTRLDAVREEIESAEAVARALRGDVARATLHLTLYRTAAAGLGGSLGGRLGEALAAGWNGLLGALVVALALWPLWLVLAAAWIVRRAWRRRSSPPAIPPDAPPPASTAGPTSPPPGWTPLPSATPPAVPDSIPPAMTEALRRPPSPRAATWN